MDNLDLQFDTPDNRSTPQAVRAEGDTPAETAQLHDESEPNAAERTRRTRSRASSRSSRHSKSDRSISRSSIGSRTSSHRERRSKSDPSTNATRGRNRSRSTSRTSRNRDSIRSNTRVSMDNLVQTQKEADEAVQVIQAYPGGELLLSLISKINKTPGNLIDLKRIAAKVERMQSPPSQTADFWTQSHANKTQYLDKSPCPKNEESRQHIRNTLLDIELNDRTVQRRMIECPQYFRPGRSSITDKDQVRLDKVKIYFSAAFGSRKFSGKRGRNNDDISILQLLQDFNHAQSNIPVTENEFITFLTKAMIGDAHKTMLNYADLHRSGQMSIEDIYLSLTDIYFCDMRPNTAMQKLRDMTEHSHPYGSLSEAHNDLLQLCNLASLASRARERQIVLASDWYQQTLLRIIPREYKPMATSLVESCGNYKGKDLEPHEILNSLNKIRHPIDDLLRRAQSKSNPLRVKKNAIVSENDVEWEGDDLGLLENSRHEYKGRIKLVAGQAREGNKSFWKTKNKSGPVQDKRNPENIPCRLCGNPKHDAGSCPLFPEGQNMVAGTECRRCKSGLFHLMRFCPQNLAEEATKN